jgi:deazaflavin-dependent oxidoreductase (nitroreductase family)
VELRRAPHANVQRAPHANVQRAPHANVQRAPHARRRRIVFLQRYLLNPPMKVAVWLGLVPGHMLVETTGRVSGNARRTVVGCHRVGETLWVVAEQGRHAGYVRNLEANPQVRLRLGRRWRPASAHIVDADDPVARLRHFSDAHARIVHRVGTALLSVRFDLR